MMPGVESVLARIDPVTAIAAVALVIMVWVVIKLGRILLMAAIFGVVAGGASLSQGHSSRDAALHAGIAFGAAAILFFIIKLTRSLLLWLTLTAAGVASLIFFGLHRAA